MHVKSKYGFELQRKILIMHILWQFYVMIFYVLE
jgi:hypothetical protein